MSALVRKSIFLILFLLSAAVCIGAQTHFVFTSNTGNDMTVVVPKSSNPTIDEVALANGDEIGVFTPGGLCVGASIWNGSSNIAIAVHGDNDRTTIVDGIVAEELLFFRVWDASLSKEWIASVTYSSGGPKYLADGTAILSSLIVVTPFYKVTYEGNGNIFGTIPVDANNYHEGVTATILDNTGSLEKTGYSFAGWNTAADGSGTSYAAGATVTMGTANVVLYAKWILIPTYTVTYNGNGNTGGTVPMDANTYQQAATVTALSNSGGLVRTGYTFAGWNTAAEGSGTSYAAGATFTMGTANVVLFAKWTSNPTYTVTYDGNGNTSGAVPVDANIYLQGSTVISLPNTGGLTKTGYTFKGWNTVANGSGTSYAVGAAFTIETANLTLYAQWTLIPTYAVTYNGNENTSGTVPNDANSYQQGAAVTVLGNTGTLVKTGYTFSGWNTLSNGNGVSYSGGTTFSMGSTNVILYAQWTINKYTLTVNQAIGQNTPVKIKDTTVTYGDTARLTAPIVQGCFLVNWRITSGTALLLDSTQSTCRIIVVNGNAEITAFYSYATPAFNTIRKVPTYFDLNYKNETLNFAIPEIPGVSCIPVNIRIFDIRGHFLGCLIDKNMSPGYYSLNIGIQGKRAAGIIIGKMESWGYASTVKIVSKSAH